MLKRTSKQRSKRRCYQCIISCGSI